MTTKAQAKKALKQLIMKVGPGFHPDTKAKDYVNIHTNALTFPDPKEREEFDKILNIIWGVLGEKIYSEGIKIHDELFHIW